MKSKIDTSEIITQIKERLSKEKKDWNEYPQLSNLLNYPNKIEEDRNLITYMFGIKESYNLFTNYDKDKGEIISISIYNSNQLILNF